MNAERAWAELSTELRPPRGKVDLVVADNVDYVNGYATPLPTNRIVIYAHPPIDAPEVRNYDDWSRLVITHELTHIFHIDRADGIWGLGRKVFGRHPALFPNLYMPAWLIEGLAVYYESRITGAGRLEGAEHYMIARAAAEAGRIPRIGQLSRETTRFPGGVVVYAYGGQLFDYLSRTRGARTIPEFVGVSSRVIIPFTLNRKAKRAFGISFENAWRDWRDSLVKSSAAARDPFPGWRELTRDGRTVAFPRWLGDTAILYSGANGKDVASAYSVTLDGGVTRLGRRNGVDANVALPDGSIVFSQPDFTDRYHVRNDLYIERNGVQRRLTRGARLSHPDVRKDGDIVAVQSSPGTTGLVRVSRDGAMITPLASGTAEVQWGEPRWSPDGASVAAVRALRGGISEIVVLDTLGKIRGVAVSEPAILAGPSWSAGGDRLFYTSTRSGASQVFVVTLANPIVPSTGRVLSSASTGVFSPAPSRDGRGIAALSFALDGYHVGYAPLPASGGAQAPPLRASRAGCTNCRLPAIPAMPVTLDQLGPPGRYSPWRSLAPRYWEPLVEGTSDTGASFGAATSGSDVVGRHGYYGQLLHDTKQNETDAFAVYQYFGLGQPSLSFSVSQEWDHFGIFDNAGDEVGDLARRERTFGLSAGFARPRARTGMSFSVGADVESRTYSSDPDTLLARLPELFARTRRYPSVFTSLSWTNTKRPQLSISREDGVSLGASVRQRWEAGEFSSGSKSVIGVAAAYKSLDLPGFSHHVLAVRGAGGYADRRAISTFSAGGLSGGSLAVLGGLTVGEGGRTFGVRGFPPSAEQGIRALAGTVEYRLPLAAPSARVPFIPIFFDRISLSAFSETGRAWCPASAEGVCEPDRGGPWLASAGGEVDLDTALYYDIPARIRLGVAFPFAGRREVGARAASVYLTLGSSF